MTSILQQYLQHYSQSTIPIEQQLQSIQAPTDTTHKSILDLELNLLSMMLTQQQKTEETMDKLNDLELKLSGVEALMTSNQNK